MPTDSVILILVAIDDPQSRNRVLELLSTGKFGSPTAPYTSARVQQVPLAEVETSVRRHHLASPDSGVVLISDGLVDEHDFQQPNTAAARILLDAFGAALTMIAVMSHPARVMDIERSVSRQTSQEELVDAVNRCLRKLSYLRKPALAKRTNSTQYVFRVLQFEHQLLEYFQFRHDVYSVMCYL